MRQFNPGYRFLYPPIYATNHSPRAHGSRPVNPSASKKHVSTRRSTPPGRRRVFGSPGRHNRARGSDGGHVSDTFVKFPRRPFGRYLAARVGSHGSFSYGATPPGVRNFDGGSSAPSPPRPAA